MHSTQILGGYQRPTARHRHADPGGPWFPVGVGVTTGEAVYGVVGSAGGLQEVTALGDAANVAARLASHAAAREVLISQGTAQQAGLDSSELELRWLELKGKREPMDVRVRRRNHTRELEIQRTLSKGEEMRSSMHLALPTILIHARLTGCD